MLFGVDSLLRGRVAFTKAGEAAGVLVLLLVQTLLVKREVAGEEHDLPRRAQDMAARAVGQFGNGPLHPRRRHLAGQRALPDQLVQALMVARPRAVPAEVGRADRLVRFLRVFRLGGVLTGFVGNVARVVPVRDR